MTDIYMLKAENCIQFGKKDECSGIFQLVPRFLPRLTKKTVEDFSQGRDKSAVKTV